MHKTAGQRHSPQARHVARTHPVRRVLTSLLTIFDAEFRRDLHIGHYFGFFVSLFTP